jgi:hypothetical protein
MPSSIHGDCEVHWCGQMCLAVLRGAFNREGVARMAEAVRAAWHAAGEPGEWAHVVDLRRWEGGTPDSFEVAHELVNWTMAHGVCAIVRLCHSNFITRIVDRQGTLEDSTVPVMDFADPDEAWAWLQVRGLAREECRQLIPAGD